jgi:hypothetical protein
MLYLRRKSQPKIWNKIMDDTKTYVMSLQHSEQPFDWPAMHPGNKIKFYSLDIAHFADFYSDDKHRK